MDVPIHYGGDRAYYSPTGDYVQMPQRETFFTAEDYYSTLGHELSHATGAASRLNRPLDSLYANAESYALEELRAEIASTYGNVPYRCPRYNVLRCIYPCIWYGG